MHQRALQRRFAGLSVFAIQSMSLYFGLILSRWMAFLNKSKYGLLLPNISLACNTFISVICVGERKASVLSYVFYEWKRELFCCCFIAILVHTAFNVECNSTSGY